MAYWSNKDNLDFIPLTEEAEQALFRKYYKGDLEARDSIIQHHLKHVTKLALRFAKQAFPDDLAVSAGIDGLMQAMKAKTFNPRAGYRFSSYVIPFIRGKVFRAMKAHHMMPAPPPEPYSHRPCDVTLTGALCDEGNSPTASIALSRGFISLEQIPAPEETVDHEAEEKDLSEYRIRILNKCLAKLRPLDAEVVRKVALEGMTLAEVAAEKGHARQNVGPTYLRGIARLKVLLEKYREELHL